MSKIIETDFKTFVKFWSVPLLIGIAILIIYKALTGLMIVGASIFLALALKPLVRTVEGFFNRHFGKNDKFQTLSAVMSYLIVIIVIGGVVAVIGPVVVNETSKFIQQLPSTFENTLGGWDGINNIGKNIGIENLRGEIENALTGLSNNILGFIGNNLVSGVSGVADVVVKIMLVLVLTLLFLLEGPGMMQSFWTSTSKLGNSKAVKAAQRTVYRMMDVISTYVSRQVMIALLDGCASTIIVFILSLIFNFSSSLAIPMGMITMLFYLIPMFGQFIGGTLVTVLLLSSNWVAGLIFAVVYIVYAQIEGNVIAPKVQGSAMKLQPVIVLSSIVIGTYMLGLIGAIIAVPIAGCIKVIAEEYPNIKAAREQS